MEDFPNGSLKRDQIRIIDGSLMTVLMIDRHEISIEKKDTSENRRKEERKK